MPISDPFRNPTGIIPRVRTSYAPGGAAGAHTVTGISENEDRLISVIAITFTLTEGAPNTVDSFQVDDLTDEFTISADDTIDNTGGTDTTGNLLVVVWNDHDWGEQTDAAWQE